MIDEMLEHLERKFGGNPPPQCWFNEINPSLSYCPDCANLIEAATGYEFDGGHYSPPLSDNCEHCEKCGVVLHYILSENGLVNEITHYLESESASSLNAEEAYHLYRMLSSAENNKNFDAIALLICWAWAPLEKAERPTSEAAA